MSKPTILVTGATGLLGPYLLERARSAGQALGLARSGTDIVCDLTDATSVREVIRETKPNLVIHAAAMSDVDVCERAPDTADRINRGATQTHCQTTRSWYFSRRSPSTRTRRGPTPKTGQTRSMSMGTQNSRARAQR